VRAAELAEGDRIAFGSVAFYLAMGDLDRIGGEPAPGRTVPTRSSDLVFAATLRGAEGEIELTQRVAGGVARCGDNLLELARLEFALLKVLVERRRQQPDPELCFVSSEELARALDFRSRDADGENVRELVRRVRRKLKQAGVDGLIESRQGVGYRVSWPVAPVDP
jgi:DNA-binding response OmpR family regulator